MGARKAEEYLSVSVCVCVCVCVCVGCGESISQNYPERRQPQPPLSVQLAQGLCLSPFLSHVTHIVTLGD